MDSTDNLIAPKTNSATCLSTMNDKLFLKLTHPVKRHSRLKNTVASAKMAISNQIRKAKEASKRLDAEYTGTVGSGRFLHNHHILSLVEAHPSTLMQLLFTPQI